jgi:hypothetical protein
MNQPSNILFPTYKINTAAKGKNYQNNPSQYHQLRRKNYEAFATLLKNKKLLSQFAENFANPAAAKPSIKNVET